MEASHNQQLRGDVGVGNTSGGFSGGVSREPASTSGTMAPTASNPSQDARTTVVQIAPMVWRVVVPDTLSIAHSTSPYSTRELWGRVEWVSHGGGASVFQVSLDEIRQTEPNGQTYSLRPRLLHGVAAYIRHTILLAWVESLSDPSLHIPLPPPQGSYGPSPYPDPFPPPTGSTTAHRRQRKPSPVASPIAPLVDPRAAQHLDALDQLDAAIDSLSED